MDILKALGNVDVTAVHLPAGKMGCPETRCWQASEHLEALDTFRRDRSVGARRPPEPKEQLARRENEPGLVHHSSG